MKILHVINTLEMGGAEKLVSEIVPLLIVKGYEVEVAVFVGDDTPFYQVLKNSKVNMHIFSTNGSVYNPYHIIRLRRIIKHFDIIHTHNTSPQLFGAIASIFVKSTLITTEHSTENRRRSNPILKVLDRWMYGRYNKIICISYQTKESILKYLPHINRKLITIYNGININAYRFAKELDLPHRKFIICMVAGFRYQKDHETVLKALSRIDKTKYELWLVGDGVRRPLIEDAIKTLHLSENVKLWGNRTDVPTLLKSSDIVLQSSHIEGFGLAAVEGMAVGKAVVTSDVPGLHEVVEGAGILFKHGDDIELADIIKRLIEDSEMRREVARKCSERAEKFDISKMVDAYSQLYDSLLCKRRAMWNIKPRIFMVGYSTDKGGVEAYIQNICDGLSTDFEIVLHLPVMKIGGKEWRIPANRHNPVKYYRFWWRFFRKNRFDVVYFNTCDIVSIDILRFAKKAGIPVRIIHSHNTAREYVSNGLKGLMHRWQERQSRKHLDRYATHLFACSKNAGDWMFDGRQYIIIKNGIDIDKYVYNPLKEEKAASKLMRQSHPVVACLGRLDSQKNPMFSLKVFQSLCSISADAQCLFIGDGEFRQALEAEVRAAGLQNRILFTGGVDNVNEWLSYVDCILMPSLFEGLPFALVEAQAAGLHCLVSDNVSQESNITGLVEYMSLNEPAVIWARRALALAAAPRADVAEELVKTGFSIQHTAETVASIIKNALK